MKIKNVHIYTRISRLKKTYRLSFVTLKSFQSFFFLMELENGSKGLGEATVLPGYGGETFDQIKPFFNDAKDQLIGKSIEVVHDYIEQNYSEYPFGISAIGTALDFASGKVAIPKRIDIPMIYAVSSTPKNAQLINELIQSVKKGYGTIKVKIGRDPEADLELIKELIVLPSELRFRFDANQRYSPNDSRRFLDLANRTIRGRMDYLEQPLGRDNWNDSEVLCREYPGQILLDESIFTRSDIQRAANIGVKFIKLKLFKSKGLIDLISNARFAKELGLEVVLGNGVATDVCNLAEAIAYSDLNGICYGAFEGNGFARMEKCINNNSIYEQNGKLIWSLNESRGSLEK